VEVAPSLVVLAAVVHPSVAPALVVLAAVNHPLAAVVHLLAAVVHLLVAGPLEQASRMDLLLA
jgi:hypothetical protein